MKNVLTLVLGASVAFTFLTGCCSAKKKGCCPKTKAACTAPVSSK